MLQQLEIKCKSLLAAQDNCCWLCGKKMKRAGRDRDPLSRSRDHLIPKSAGGTNLRANILFAHAACNSDRGNKALTVKEEVKALNYRLKAIAYQLSN